MRKLMAGILAIATVAGAASCAGDGGPISVVTREEGSGTRGAFIELFGIEVKEGDTKVDKTTKEAIKVDKTDIVITNISGDKAAIGYISVGSLKKEVKALKIDGVEATPENVKNGSYKAQRPFNIAYKSDISPLAQDFVNYILSKQGQEIVANNKYIEVVNSPAEYASAGLTGKIVVSGSSSVTPVMEKLKEGYLAINSGVTLEVQMTDSTGGMTDAINGISDIGMASRELKDPEKEKLSSVEIAIDGIAVIVHPDNKTDGLTSEQVKSIFIGETTDWGNIK